MAKILLVDDEPRIARVVRDMVEGADWQFAYADNGADALDAVARETPDLIIMDVMMPKMDGFTACRELRARGVTVPVIFLSAKGDIVDKGVGFAAGGDDYMVKPIDVDELLLRIEALLRRARIEAEKRLVVGSTVLDAEERSAYVGGKEITLTVREFDLLYKLLSYPRRTFSRAQLMDEFWDGETSASLRAVDVYITRIRDKMSVSDDFKITTVHGLGYKAVPGA